MISEDCYVRTLRAPVSWCLWNTQKAFPVPKPGAVGERVTGCDGDRVMSHVQGLRRMMLLCHRREYRGSQQEKQKTFSINLLVGDVFKKNIHK